MRKKPSDCRASLTSASTWSQVDNSEEAEQAILPGLRRHRNRTTLSSMSSMDLCIESEAGLPACLCMPFLYGNLDTGDAGLNVTAHVFEVGDRILIIKSSSRNWGKAGVVVDPHWKGD